MLTIDDLDELKRECETLLSNRSLVDAFSKPTRVALIGPPNAGKSTLVNALADRAVSLVSDRPGTTRDWVEAPGEAEGFPIHWLDTAGLRDSDDPLEQAGISSARRLITLSDAVILVLDSNTPESCFTLDTLAKPTLTVLAKADLASADNIDPNDAAIRVSALNGMGLGMMLERLVDRLGRSPERVDQPAPFSKRQSERLEAVLECANLTFARENLKKLNN